jgi:hypothetical protein
MPEHDTARHGAPQPANDALRHTLSISDVETALEAAGVPRSRRQVIRYAETGMLDAIKVPGPSGEQWYIAPASVPKVIGDLKQWEAQRAHGEVRHTPSDSDTPSPTLNTEPDMAAHDAPRPTTSEHDTPDSARITEPDMARHSTPRHAMTDQEVSDGSTATHPDTARRTLTEIDIFEHPYVKKLEAQVDKLEGKLDAQVRRTEEIQQKSQAQLIELQRMIAVGQSETLANFMLKAREWVLGKGSDSPRETSEESRSA